MWPPLTSTSNSVCHSMLVKSFLTYSEMIQAGPETRGNNLNCFKGPTAGGGGGTYGAKINFWFLRRKKRKLLDREDDSKAYLTGCAKLSALAHET